MDSVRQDVLNEVLQAIRLRSVVYCRAAWTAKWGYYTQTPSQPHFHFLTTGRCWFDIENLVEPTPIQDGDVVIVAPGQAYRMRDHLDSPVQRLGDVLACRSLEDKRARVLNGGNGGEATTMLCGRFLLEECALNPLARSLPPALIMRRESDISQSLYSAFRVIEAEFSAGRPGADALVSRLMDVIFLQAIRASLSPDRPQKPSWLGALLDPAIGKAIVAIHTNLGSPLTVDALATQVGMSRSAFATRFVQLLGEPPMTYITRWRISRAAHLLRATDDKVAGVATRVGYDSVPALNKAFKQHLGQSPGAYRRRFLAANKEH